MIARAAKLLRMAGALVEQNLRAAAVNPVDDLDFWWGSIPGVERGFLVCHHHSS
jgi:hypothetical protein